MSVLVDNQVVGYFDYITTFLPIVASVIVAVLVVTIIKTFTR